MKKNAGVRSSVPARRAATISREHRASIAKRAIGQTLFQFPRRFLNSVHVDLFTKDQFYRMISALFLTDPNPEMDTVNRLFNTAQSAVRDLVAMRACVEAKLDQENLEQLIFTMRALASIWTETMSDERIRDAFNFQALVQHHIKRNSSNPESPIDFNSINLSENAISALLLEANNKSSVQEYFMSANTSLMNTLIDTERVLVFLKGGLEDRKIKKAPEYRFVSRIAEGWHIATGQLPTVTRVEEKEHRTPFQRFLEEATPPPHIGSEVLRNVIDRMKLEQTARAGNRKKSALKNPKKGSPQTP